ncbi:MAG: sensor with HAMP domain protein, partial [Candidatus Electrothrix sp. AUS4]|nr:sensor with HAMP domain protein [Candidatus Electrothrix sp. AUS4]
ARLQVATNITERKNIEDEREQLIEQLQKALSEIRVLQGILPICAFCKNIRNDKGYYEQIESYIHKHSGVDFSHTICPDCMKKHYPELS